MLVLQLLFFKDILGGLGAASLLAASLHVHILLRTALYLLHMSSHDLARGFAFLFGTMPL